jgi:hypothetical protein
MRRRASESTVGATEHHAEVLARRIRRAIELSILVVPACSLSPDLEKRDVCLTSEGDAPCKEANAVTAEEMSSFAPELFVSVASGPVRTVGQHDQCCYRVLISGAILPDPTSNTITIIERADGGPPMQRLNRCFAVDIARTCPPMSDAGPELQATLGDRTLESIETPPDRQSRTETSCCYTALLRKKDWSGRPYVVRNDEPPVVAPLIGTIDWADPKIDPDTSALSEIERAQLAAHWSREAVAEHASVASFGRFAMELLAADAPSDLIAAAHQAAIEEIRHAKLCFALARAYAGRDIRPGAFPFGGAVPLRAHDALIGATIAEGCVNETIASLIAHERLVECRDPAVRHVLSVIAEDEAGHAELAWRCLQWLVDRGTQSSRDLARGAFSIGHPDAAGDVLHGEGPLTKAVAAHGLVASRRIDRVREIAFRSVVLPNAAALFGGAALGSGSELV